MTIKPKIKIRHNEIRYRYPIERRGESRGKKGFQEAVKQ